MRRNRLSRMVLVGPKPVVSPLVWLLLVRRADWGQQLPCRAPCAVLVVRQRKWAQRCSRPQRRRLLHRPSVRQGAPHRDGARVSEPEVHLPPPRCHCHCRCFGRCFADPPGSHQRHLRLAMLSTAKNAAAPAPTHRHHSERSPRAVKTCRLRQLQCFARRLAR